MTIEKKNDLATYPVNDYRSYLAHSAKGTTWKKHKYVAIKNGRYIYKKEGPGSSLGRYGQGNIDLFHRPVLENEDGSISTVESFSTNIDGKEVLLPTIAYDKNGKPVRISEDEAIDRYIKTGKHLGKFDTPEQATKYAIKLHEDQERLYKNRTSSKTSYVIRPKNTKKYKRASSALKKKLK